MRARPRRRGRRRLRERHAGEWEGRTRAEIDDGVARATSSPAGGPPGYEADASVLARVLDALHARSPPPTTGDRARRHPRGSGPDPRAPPRRRRRRPAPQPRRSVAAARRRRRPCWATGSCCSTPRPASTTPRADLSRSGQRNSAIAPGRKTRQFPEAGDSSLDRPCGGHGGDRVRTRARPGTGGRAASPRRRLRPARRHASGRGAGRGGLHRGHPGRHAPGPPRAGGRRGLHPAPAGRRSTSATSPLCFGRLDLLPRPPTSRRPAAPSTSAGSRSPTTTSPRSSSTGAPRWPSRSTGPPPSSRWASPAAATSRPTAGASSGIDDEVFDADATEESGLHGGGGGRAARRARPERTGRMRDIVATIQAEQDEAIRADLTGILVVVGRPRHRQDRRRAPPRRVPALHAPQAARRRRACCSSGPSAIFLRYIDEVLPSLGEDEVTLATPAALKPRLRVRGHRVVGDRGGEGRRPHGEGDRRRDRRP